ncbi:MAG: SRPBCC domain-containing protein [Gammaproteobacteria bacterium]|nr:SRPBCC domain-containing protein [Gammaproteobacteria bacterium]
MKKIFLFILVLVGAGFVYLAVQGNKLQEVKTEIDISAPPSKIWPIIMDINKWEKWSPVINASRGAATVGSELTITMIGKEKDKDGPTYNPIITKLEEPNYLSWRAHMLAGFIFTNYKILELEETDSGTRLTHKEQFKGLLTPIMRGHMEKGVPPMLNAMNKALKDLAEK